MTTEITRDFLRTLREELDAAIAAVAVKNGVAINVGNASFTPTTANFKLEVAVNVDGPAGASAADLKARADWKRYGPRLGLEPEWLDVTFAYGGRATKIIGLEPKRTQYPVLVEVQAARGGATVRKLLPADVVAAILSSTTLQAA